VDKKQLKERRKQKSAARSREISESARRKKEKREKHLEARRVVLEKRAEKSTNAKSPYGIEYWVEKAEKR
jgi:hypothetical protein